MLISLLLGTPVASNIMGKSMPSARNGDEALRSQDIEQRRASDGRRGRNAASVWYTLLMTFGLDHPGDSDSLADPPKEIMKSLQVCVLKNISGSLGRLSGEVVCE